MNWKLRMLSAGLMVAAAAPAEPVRARAQSRDAASVLAEMRAALGGEAALDAIRSLTVGGSVRQVTGRFSRNMSIDLSVLFPDHFLDVRRDVNTSGPMVVDITYYKGFRGDTLIRRTDSTIPFPPDPWPQTPAVIAEREREITLANKREFARLALILFGRSFSSYPLQFVYVAAERRDGRLIDVLEASATDGYRMRLSIDASTHLPAMIAYLAPQGGAIVSMTSTVTVKGNVVVSQTPAEVSGQVDPPGRPMVEHRLVPSNFKVQDGMSWPHRLTETVGTELVSEMDLGKYRLNPKLEPKRFEIKR